MDKIFELKLDVGDMVKTFVFYHENKKISTFKKDCNSIIRKYSKQYVENEKIDNLIGGDNIVEYSISHLTELGYTFISSNSYTINCPIVIDEQSYNKQLSRIIGTYIIGKIKKINSNILKEKIRKLK